MPAAVPAERVVALEHRAAELPVVAEVALADSEVVRRAVAGEVASEQTQVNFSNLR